MTQEVYDWFVDDFEYYDDTDDWDNPLDFDEYQPRD